MVMGGARVGQGLEEARARASGRAGGREARGGAIFALAFVLANFVRLRKLAMLLRKCG